MEQYIEVCGYIALYVGMWIEGEIILLSGLISAKTGILNIWLVLGIVFIGAQSVDWTWFLLGRLKGKPFVENRPKLLVRLSKVNALFEKNPTTIMLVYRFMVGFRSLIPLIIGLGKIPVRVFAAFSALGTLLWILVFGTIGYLCAEVFVEQFDQAMDHKWEIAIGLLVTGVMVGVFQKVRKITRKGGDNTL